MVNEEARCKDTPDMLGKTAQDYSQEYIKSLTENEILMHDVKRIIALQLDRAEIDEAINDIIATQKSRYGRNPKLVREMVKLYQMDQHERYTQELERDNLKCALKMY